MQDKNKKQEAIKSGKEEMNLSEFPITLLSKRHNSECKTIEFSSTVTSRNGKLIKREWIVTGSDKYGLPLAYDNDVLLALMAIGKENDFKSQIIYFSRYRLLQILGWENKGENYRRIEEAFLRFKGVNIYTRNAFWNNERKTYSTITEGFNIIDNYKLFDSPPGRKKQQDTLSLSWVKLNDILYKSIKSGYIKTIDLELYFKLESVITKRLFRYLDKKRYKREQFEINLFTLAKSHIGLNKCKYPSQIKEKLNPAHEELKSKGFLKSVVYKSLVDEEGEKIIYTFMKKDDVPELSGTSILTLAAGISEVLIKELLKVGLTRKTAEQLVQDYPESLIDKQLKALQFRKAKDPAAILIKSIHEDWAIPAEAKAKNQRKKKNKEAERRQMEENLKEAAKQAQIESYLAKLTQEEFEKIKEQAIERARPKGTMEKVRPPEGAIRGFLEEIVGERLKL